MLLLTEFILLWGRFSIPLSPLLLVLDYSFLFMFFSFAVREFSLPRVCIGLFLQGVGKVVA
jgi:hypothetical protein